MNKDEMEFTASAMNPDAYGNDAVIQIAEIGAAFTIPKKDEPELFNIVIRTVSDYCRAGGYTKGQAERFSSSLGIILNEFVIAEQDHPGWPEDKIHAVAIMAEEAGEAVQAANDCVWSDGAVEHLIQELAQTGAMCLRAMMNL